MQVLDGSIGVLPEGYSLLNNDTQVTFSGLTPKTFQEKFKTIFQEPEYKNYAFLDLGRFIYDGMWTLIVALDKTVNKISMGNDSGCEDKSGDMVPLEYFNYTNEKLGCIMKQSFSEVMFTGVTGNIQFDVNGSRPDNSLFVKQYRLSSNKTIRRDTIGIITVRDGNSSIFTFSIGESNSTIWKNGKPPYDGFPIEEIHTNNLALIILYNFIALCGIGFATVCFIFNIVFRNKKIVKLASPKLNYLIILGSVILFCCVFFYTYSSPDSAVQTGFCNIRTWLFSIGYTLCFAVILSKALRIYYIFNNPKPQKKALKDIVLLPPIISIVAIGLVIILVGSAIPQSRLMSIEHEDLEHMQEINDEGKIVHYSIYKCIQDGSIIWLAVSFGYKALLQLVAMFMAFHTRRVKVKALNDSKEIAVIIYINSIILTLLIVTEFALVGYHNTHAALFGLGLLIDGFLFLGFIFIPKMISLYKDPKGDNVFSHSLATGVVGEYTSKKSPQTYDISEEAVSVLRARVKELETKLSNQEVSEAIIDGDLVSNGEI
jgi:gamma-aminobutyric acid type B receptor